MKLSNPVKSKKVRLRKKRLFFILALALLVIVLLLGMRFLGSFQDLQNEGDWARNLRSASRNAGTNYLIYGLVEKNGEAIIEELFFLNYPEDDASFHTVFIPGETLLHRLADKIVSTEPLAEEENDEEKSLISVFTPSHFYNEGGGELLIAQISLFLNAPVHHFIEINYNGISPLVDSRGGIPYKGYTLKGEDYLDYFLKGEKDEEPLERASRRARVLNSLVSFLGGKKGILSTSASIREASPYLDTDLSWKEMQSFFADLQPFFDPQNLIVQLPGMWRDFNGDLYFEPNRTQIAQMMGNLGKEFIIPREMITVEVLNGSGVAGIASKAAQILESEGFQVVKIDNADNYEYQRSQVISRLEDIEPAREVAVLIPGAEFFKEPLPDYPVMVTVVIGKNFSL
ncbi:MAG: LCP family protein [Bacillota bacterium]|nr:LCP family protein [Bacillota bacterium]